MFSDCEVCYIIVMYVYYKYRVSVIICIRSQYFIYSISVKMFKLWTQKVVKPQCSLTQLSGSTYHQWHLMAGDKKFIR